MNAAHLLKLCESTSHDFCLGYISGFYDGHTTNNYLEQSCPPTDESGLYLEVTFDQMVKVFLN
jgi:hypothetical protein